MANINQAPRRRRITTFAAVLAVVVALAVILIALNQRDRSRTGATAATYQVTRGDLTISVTESGSVKALNATVVKSEVEGQTTIISIVDEGTFVTPEDVDANMVLVELDASDIKERLMQQEITFANAEASYTDAKEAYQIQLKQNESDLNASRLKLKFAVMDLQKYLGETVATTLLDSLDPNGNPGLSIVELSHSPGLGGTGLQKQRELNANIILAREKLGRAHSRLIWTKRLAEKNYASKSDVEADEFEVNSLEIDLQQAQMALELFLRYEFPKEAEKLLSDCQEAGRELQRTEARARSQIAQAQAKLKSNRATHNLQQERLEKLQRQLGATVIKATAPGMVVYATSGNRWGRGDAIEPGTAIRERQEILSLTNMEEMAVELKIHEVAVSKVKVGQPARITPDAFADKTFDGEVLKVGQLPDQQNWLFNPDLKVYAGEVSLRGAQGALKPGLTAKVEIIIAELQDVLYVPVQAVANRDGRKVCYVDNAGRLEQRAVETGQFNESFIEITSGLAEGEPVSLSPPRLIESDQPDRKQKPAPPKEQPPA